MFPKQDTDGTEARVHFCGTRLDLESVRVEPPQPVIELRLGRLATAEHRDARVLVVGVLWSPYVAVLVKPFVGLVVVPLVIRVASVCEDADALPPEGAPSAST